MSYLRFSPAEYVTLASLCLELPDKNVSSFKRLLVAALADIDPVLANRINGLGKGRIGLLYFHFRSKPPVHRKHDLNDEEVRTLDLVFQGFSFPIRSLRTFKESVVRLLQTTQFALARKVADLSSSQFERLYKQAVCRRTDD